MTTSQSRELREVTVFATGDPEAASTWSNIPYFFVATLRRRGIRVNTVSLATSRVLKTATYDLILRFPLRAIMPSSDYSYFRTPVHDRDVARRIRRAMAAYPDSQANFFLTYSFSAARLSPKPSALICDWPFEFRIRRMLRREPDFLERGVIRRERRAIDSAALVVSLFAGVAKTLKQDYPKARIAYLGHVINGECERSVEELVAGKEAERRLLFIGGPHYREGAQRLVAAWHVLRGRDGDLRLDVVGMRDADVGGPAPGLTCHGYLDKSVAAERAVYSELLGRASVIVNPTPRWAGFSSLVEAMYHCTPVVTTPYDEFVESFGAELGFGAYCREDTIEALVGAIARTLDATGYPERCRAARAAASDHTWDGFVDRLLPLLGFASPRA